MPRYFTLSSFAPSLIGSISAVAFRPKTFFEEMESTESYRNSVIFLLLILMVPMLVDSYSISEEKVASVFPALEGLGLLLAWLWAGYIYWSIRLFTKYKFEHADAFQVAAYSYVPVLLDFSVLLIVPAFFWQLFITWRGMVHFAGIPGKEAFWFMFIPVIMLLSAGLAFVMLAALSGIDFISPLLYDDYVANPHR